MPFLQAAEAKLAEEREKRTAVEEEVAALAADLTEAVAVIDDKDARLAVCSFDALTLCQSMLDARHDSGSAASIIGLLGSTVTVMEISAR